MTEPLISVILPTYNRAPLLREAVESVLRQSYAHWELLVIDDGSTDGTADLLSQLQDLRVRPRRLDHTGNPGRVRNVGLAEARGDYVAFLDDDDLWDDAKLATQLRGLQHSSCRWGYTGFRRIDALGAELRDPNVRPWRPLGGWILEPLLRIEAVVPLPTVMVERVLLAEAGGFDETLLDCEDYELWFRLAVRSPAHVEGTQLASVRVHPEHRQANREQVNASWIAVYQRTAATLNDKPLRALCLERAAEHMVLLARLVAEQGHRRRGLGLLARSARQVGGTWGWWTALARALLPGPVIAALQRLRRRAHLRGRNQ